MGKGPDRRRVHGRAQAGSEPPMPPAGELALIDRIRSRVLASGSRTPELRLGIGDDCAILRPHPGEEIVVTTDLCLEGRHFRRDWHPPASIGHRTLARGLSDLAAMGARPVAAFLSLALPREVAADGPFLDGFLDGLLALAAQARVPLAGGDTSESPSDAILADIVLLGAVPRGWALRRDRAVAGDRLFCTGSLGGSAAELQSLAQNQAQRHAATSPMSPSSSNANPHPQLFPQPRLQTGLALLRRGLATAAMDLSDGLSTDLRHLCTASGIAADIDLASLPLHPLAAALGLEKAIELALHGGEDYELLFTAPPRTRLPAKLGGVRLTEIGRLKTFLPDHPRITQIAADGTRSGLDPGGWEHLR